MSMHDAGRLACRRIAPAAPAAVATSQHVNLPHPNMQAGQFIGARADFVPQQICERLSILNDRVSIAATIKVAPPSRPLSTGMSIRQQAMLCASLCARAGAAHACGADPRLPAEGAGRRRP